MFKVGIIGCGKPFRSEGSTGFGMSHAHARGYTSSPDCQLVALADISEENALAFQAIHGGERIYTDYHQMLADEQLDIVSISTWPHLHAPMVIACAEAGVRAIHCEKPMAPTFGEARQMLEACERNGVQLTFNHQRRFGEPFRKAKALLKAGTIGDLVRLEGNCDNLFDWGTHWFDMICFYTDETDVEWVIGQLDSRDSRRIFGALIESQGLSQFQFKNGVMGLLITGSSVNQPFANRLIGTDGMIDVGHSAEIPLRMWGKGQSGWTTVEVAEGLHGSDYVERGVHDLVDALKTGREPELSGRRAFRATELIFATYESSRRRARVDLPLTIDDSPLVAMIEAGEIPS